MRTTTHPKPRTAFTLIELLMVIAIIAVLGAILLPVFARAREAARKAGCLSNEKQIAAAVQMYVQDYDETFPFVLDVSANFVMDTANTGDNGRSPVIPGATGQEPQFQLVTVVAPYVKNQSVWYCPSVGPDYAWTIQYKLGGGWRPGATMRTQGTSYAYTYTAWPYRCWRCPGQILLGGKSAAVLREPSRWPMLSEEPSGITYTGTLADAPSSVVPHFGGTNVAYGDGHAQFQHLQIVGDNWLNYHAGDGIIPGQ